MSVYFINGWENAHFLGPMRTKCGPKYQKSPQCGPNASFADLFGNTDELGLTVWRDPDQDRHDGQQGGEERDPSVMLHLLLCPHPLPVQSREDLGSSVSKEFPNKINTLTHSAHVLSTPWHHLHPPSVLSYLPCRTYYSDG